MTRQALAAAAKLLHGEQWQRALSQALDRDERLVRRWWAGDRPIPGWVRDWLVKALRERVGELERKIEELEAQSGF